MSNGVRESTGHEEEKIGGERESTWVIVIWEKASSQRDGYARKQGPILVSSLPSSPAPISQPLLPVISTSCQHLCFSSTGFSVFFENIPKLCIALVCEHLIASVCKIPSHLIFTVKTSTQHHFINSRNGSMG